VFVGLLDADVRVIDMIAICCGNATVLQSVPQLFEISREGAELPLLDSQLGLAYGRQYVHQHAVLVHVNAATTAIVLFQMRSFRWPSEGPLERNDSPTRVHPPAGGDNNAWFQ